ncbi:hypothetical protein [Paenibacillus sp. PastM-2]|nr:hypothetical protein [Paenibacillus sp. PastM-2]MDF9852080.1 hypothetical protein [Paenibacillus sp. PastM-2]
MKEPSSIMFGENRYGSNLQLMGLEPGEMNLRATFSAVAGPTPLKLLFDLETDGKHKNFGSGT